MKKIYYKSFFTLVLFLVTGIVSRAQTQIAYYPLSVNSEDSTGNFGDIMYGIYSTPPPSSACASGEYEGKNYPFFGNFSTPNLADRFNKQNFQVDADFSVSSLDFGFQGRPVFIISPSYRTIGVYISQDGFIGIKYNNSNYQYSATRKIELSTSYHLSLRYVYPNVQLLINDNIEVSFAIPSLTFAASSDPYQLCLLSCDPSNGRAFFGCLNNLAVYSGAVVLPVNLLSFDAKLAGNEFCLLNWSVADHAGKSFDIQRSHNGTSWTHLGTIVPDQSPSSVAAFSFTDVSPLPGVNFYRLKETDRNGAVSFSAVRTVDNTAVQAGVKVLPNPVKDKLYPTSIDWMTVRSVFLFNSTGMLVYTGATAKDGIDVRGYAPGSYFLMIQTTTGQAYKIPALIVK